MIRYRYDKQYVRIYKVFSWQVLCSYRYDASEDFTKAYTFFR